MGVLMIALILIPLVAIFVFSDVFSEDLEQVREIAEENGFADFDETEQSIYDGKEVETGTNEPDRLNGTGGDDAIFALGQTDYVQGFAGDDLIEAGSNNDTVYGGAGDDTIGGGTGRDQLYGGNGEDVLLGNGGDDLIFGRGGADVLVGGPGSDTLNGGSGDDFLASGLLRFSGQEDLDMNAAAFAAIQQFGGDDLNASTYEGIEAAGGFNGVNTDFRDETAGAPQGGVLNGGSGDDFIVSSAGDTVTGGSGEDAFVMGEDLAEARNIQINDFVPGEDIIGIAHSGNTAPNVVLEDRGANAVVLIRNQVLAEVEGGAGLSASDLRFFQLV
jgi:Ca2+-binding RTX toxin-like protein